MAEAATDRLTPEKPGRVRTLVTPEGIDLRLVLADAGQRATAFLIDAAIIVGALVAATIVGGQIVYSAGEFAPGFGTELQAGRFLEAADR